MKRTKMARSRRVDPLPGLTLNLEIVGIALLTIAILLALALLLPTRSGAFGVLANASLHSWFGAGAWIAVFALVAVAIIIFLEVHVLPMMAAMSGCAVGLFFALDGLLGTSARGGLVGDAAAHGLRALFGVTGADVVLIFLVFAFVVAPTGISVKALFAGIARESGKLANNARAAAATSRNGSTARSDELPLQTLPFVRAPQVEAREPQIDDAREDPAVMTPAVSAPAAASALVELPRPARKLNEEQPRATEAARQKQQSRGGYRLPDFALFNPPEKRQHSETSAAITLEETLASFGVSAKVTHLERGPSITRYELTPAKGVKVSAIKNLSDNIQLALAAQTVRIEAPIPGKSAVGIEVPNSAVSIVAIREILDHLPKGEAKLSIGLGKDITGRPIVADLTRMPHLLVAGATGAGKSVCLNVIIASLLTTCTPDHVQMLLVDPKRVELNAYNGVPHLISDCITDPKIAAGALYELTKEMDARYERFARAGVRKIEEFNELHPNERLPYIVVAIDELADLMLVAPTRVETSICRIAQLARATGIHLVIATQRPSVDVITGLIKANIPSRIAFAVSSQVDSRTILDMAGAERLLGRGDMLFLPIDAAKPLRVQGAMVTGAEIERLCEFWREQGDPDNRLAIEPSELEDEDAGPDDDFAYDAARIIIERQMASVALLQAELKVGHPRAVRLMKILEQFRVVGPAEGTKPRKILVGEADLDQLATILAPRNGEQTLL